MAASDAFIVVTLEEKDIPGAKFVYESVEKHSNTQLLRWLECRGLPKTGDRTKILKRVHSCIAAGEDKNLSISVDGGKWYSLKNESVKLTEPSSSDVPLLPYSGWRKFPGHASEMPKHFNKGHIHHHIIESVQFINKSLILNESEDEDEDIEDLHTAKPLKKGLTFFESGHVLKMQDCAKQGHYFIKAKVMASYRVNVLYDVTVTLSQLSGFVRDASCTCVASAMGRCSHVTALLYALVDYNENSDNTHTDPLLSCTSLPCTWNQGRKKDKQPKKVQDSIYSTKKQKITEVINFDPRASSTVQCSEQELNKSMLWCLGKSNQTDSMWMSLLQHQYNDYELDDDRRVILKQQSALLLENLKVPSESGFPFELVKTQGSDEWYSQRRVRITASLCKTTASLKSVSAISNYLNRQLWSTDKITTCALVYGTKNEPVARHAYQLSQDSANLKVIETGFLVNGVNPELAASPDGLILDLTEPTRYGILELKCPKILEDKEISDFKTVLSGKQSTIFCLEHTSDGEIVLKKTHPYYYQIQMQMGVTGLKFSDFVVWSSKETLVKRVRLDEEFWLSLKEKLIEFHHSYICPEIFEMRIPRELVPFKLV